MESIETYNPYCEICAGCGEDGCCSALNCTMEDGCKYKETYLKVLKEEYSFTHKFFETIYPTLDEVKQKEIMDLYMNTEL